MVSFLNIGVRAVYPNFRAKSSALKFAKAILVHEQGQSPDSLKRWYENALLGQKWFKYAVS